MDVLAGGGGLTLESWLNSEGVGTEEVSLSLDEVGGQSLGSVTVEEREGSGVGRDGDTP